MLLEALDEIYFRISSCAMICMSHLSLPAALAWRMRLNERSTRQTSYRAHCVCVRGGGIHFRSIALAAFHSHPRVRPSSLIMPTVEATIACHGASSFVAGADNDNFQRVGAPSPPPSLPLSGLAPGEPLERF